MANADFSQNNKQTAPGGFDAGSYREKAKPEQTVKLTPRQQKLAALEAKLPAALSTRAAALALSVVVMLAAFFGFGSAKLRGKYNTARQWFTAGVAADNGYNLSEELTTRMNTAANVITTASNTLGADNAEVLTAQDALTAFSNDLDGVKAGKTRLHALYEDNETLGTAIDQLYAKLQEQAADPMKMGTIETAKESQRGIVDIETLQQTNKSLIETLDELNKIQSEGRAKRAAAEQELTRIEDELKTKMMEIRS